jgi:hypothetical protein
LSHNYTYGSDIFDTPPRQEKLRKGGYQTMSGEQSLLKPPARKLSSFAI